MECERSGCCELGHKKANFFNSGSEHTDMFVGMADDAWSALFMDKAKAHWEKLHGKKIDEFAKAAVKASFDYHMSMMESEKQKAMAVKNMTSLMS